MFETYFERRRAIISNVSFKKKFRTFHLICDKTKTRQKSMEALDCNINTLIPTLSEKKFAKAYVMGYHDYNTLKPTMKEKMETRMEPHNLMEKFAVAVIKGEKVVGHIILGKTGRFAKTIFCFLKTSTSHKCYVEVIGKAVTGCLVIFLYQT